MKCGVCGRHLRRNNKTGFCHAHRRKRNRRSLETMKRKCLKCDQEFWAIGRLNRICPECHEKNRDFVDTSRYQARLGNTWVSLG